MDDPHRKPGDRDRDQLVARIRRAADEGRISGADRDIRVGNVGSAQSMAELDLIRRDLDQLEATFPTGPATGGAAGSASGTQWTQSGASTDPVAALTEGVGDFARSTARSTVRSSRGIVALLVVALVVAVAGAGAFFALRSDPPADVVDGLRDPLPISPGVSPAGEGEEPADDVSVRVDYALTESGIRSFLQFYRQRFGTTETVDLAMYGDYVVFRVPVPNRARNQGWLYRDSTGLTEFGGVTANFPGAQRVDLRDLDVQALVRNIARARTTLGVEDPRTTYVVVHHFGTAEPVPSVDIHVANQFSESGYLATTLAGDVERAFPFGG